VNISAADAKRLGQRRAQPTKAPGELLAVWVRGKLTNGKNQSQAWQLKAWGRYKRDWREQVLYALLLVDWRRGTVAAEVPKRIVFRAWCFNKLDSDGLALALAPVRDALMQAGVIHEDADRAGHEFVYQPCEIAKASTHQGVEIRVSLR